MRIIVMWGIAAIVVFGGSQAYAMGGSGNLSPGASPYAILEPQTLAPGGATLAPTAPVAPPAAARSKRSRHK